MSRGCLFRLIARTCTASPTLISSTDAKYFRPSNTQCLSCACRRRLRKLRADLIRQERSEPGTGTGSVFTGGSRDKQAVQAVSTLGTSTAGTLTIVLSLAAVFLAELIAFSCNFFKLCIFCVTLVGDNCAGFQASTLHPPSEAATPNKHKDFLERQLDSLLGHKVLDNLVCLEGHGTRTCRGALFHHACAPVAMSSFLMFLK